MNTRKLIYIYIYSPLRKVGFNRAPGTERTNFVLENPTSPPSSTLWHFERVLKSLSRLYPKLLWYMILNFDGDIGNFGTMQWPLVRVS